MNGGTCIDVGLGIGAFSCECATGFTGDACQTYSYNYIARTNIFLSQWCVPAWPIDLGRVGSEEGIVDT